MAATAAVRPLSTHWEGLYRRSQEEERSWSQAKPEPSLSLILKFSRPNDRVVDVGAGTSSLLAHLARRGYARLTAVDRSATALRTSRSRAEAEGVRPLVRIGDVARLRSLGPFDVWHDRACFHFLTEPSDRDRYVRQATRAVRPGGHLVLGTFALDGPERCSGLPVTRYDAAGLARAFAPGFRLVAATRRRHHTPWGAVQPFTFVVLERTRTR
jgi:2-polyprenyl-3-methyl-5-hydroxy-6-metoxy-1,4-benzoquinol methylase